MKFECGVDGGAPACRGGSDRMTVVLVVLAGLAKRRHAHRPTRACISQGRAGDVLQGSELRATIGAGRLRALRPAGLRRGGAALLLKLNSLGECGKVIVRDGGVWECARTTALHSKGVF